MAQAPQDRERQERTKAEQAEREKSNNPTTQKYRQYDKDAPGMHPANLPADRQEGQHPLKATRLDLEDVTGNPGHRMVNPDAPATSINPGPNQLPSGKERDALAKQPPTRSINEPVDVEPPSRAEQLGGSINEPYGSQTQRGIEGDGENTKLAQRQLQGQGRSTPTAGQGVPGSHNEPPGSQIGSNMDPATGQPIQGGEETPLVLSSISPESIPLQADGLGTFALTATGEGFTQDCVIVVNDEDTDTTFVSETELRADAVPTDTVEGTVDVEVARGEELSEALTFDFTAAAGRSSERKSTRKPSKGKRDKSKAKSKSKR
jgi:hypothetical protein